MSTKFPHKTIPIFVSHMGCPNDCAFCNQRQITGQVESVSPLLAEEKIIKALSTIKEDAVVEIGFFGGSFTGIDISLQKAFLSVAQKFLQAGKVHAIRLSTRPDYMDETITDMLKSYGVTTVELGAQSMDNAVLQANMRGHTKEDTIRASRIIRGAGLKLGLQMMTGLKGDTDQTCIATAKEIMDLEPSCVRIYPTLVLKGTQLDDWYQKGEYKPQTLDEAVTLCATLKEMFDSKHIPVIRMGLMASDHIRPNADVVAGPYHPAFGELVQSELYFRAVSAEVKGNAEIAVHPKTISAFIGNNRNNINRFLELGFRIRFIPDENVACGTFQIMK